MRRAGRMGMKTPAHLRGYSKLVSAWVARCNIDVCEDKKMMRDSANVNSRRAMMLGIDKHLNRAYKSTFRDPGISLSASLRA
jgi:hypothetical protein